MPSELAYGDAGRADSRRGQYIEGGAVLIFELELLQLLEGASKPKPVRPEHAPPDDGSFVAASIFDGARAGYTFTTREWGTGYYRDATTAAATGHANGGEDGGAAVETAASARALRIEVPASPRRPPAAAAQPPVDLFEREPLISPRRSNAPLATPSAEVAAVSAAAAEAAERRLEQQRHEIETAALDAVNAALCQLRLPTLKQALGELGLPVEGGKVELTQRLTERLTEGIALASGRGEQ